MKAGAERQPGLLSISAERTFEGVGGLQKRVGNGVGLRGRPCTIWAMSLLEQVGKDLVSAMKAKDEARLGALRMVKAALKKHEIDSMKPLTEATEMQVMGTLIKQRRESADMFRKGGREELAAKEEGEIQVLQSYLPAEPSAGEMEAAVAGAIAEVGGATQKQMGAVMKAANARLAGKRVDGKALSELVKSKLQ